MLQESLKAYDEGFEAYQEAQQQEHGESTRDYEYWEDTQLSVVDEFAEALRVRTHPALWNIEAMQSEDKLKRDLELTCTLCREILCDVEPSDIFAVLMSVAFDHIRERHLTPEDEETHR